MSELDNENPEPKANHKKKDSQNVVVLDYASLRNLGAYLLEDNESRTKLLPGLGVKIRKSFVKKIDSQQKHLIMEPNLLKTAKQYLKQSYEEHDNISQAELSNFLGLSSHLVSRQNTPNNPLGAFARKKIIANQKNKLNSIGSQLFDIQSNPQSNIQKIHLKIRSQDFRIYNNILGQSEVVYKYVFKKQRVINYKMMSAWKDCLSHEDKSEVYVPFDAEKRVQIPYTHSRIYQLNQIQKGFKEIYGQGKNRSLTIGQQSIILECIQKYLNICLKDSLKISRKDFDIIQTIINDCKLEELQNLPMCMRQIEAIFKLQATKWKHSGKLDLHDKMVESALIMGKNNFLQLTKKNVLTEFLLKNSNINQL